jgi:hypothetical protein
LVGDVSHLIANERDSAVRQNTHEERQVLMDRTHVGHQTIYGDYGRDSGEEAEKGKEGNAAGRVQDAILKDAL